jgi:hypothetical protein
MINDDKENSTISSVIVYEWCQSCYIKTYRHYLKQVLTERQTLSLNYYFELFEILKSI